MSRPGPRQADCPTGSAHRSVGSPRLPGPGPCSDGSSRSSPLLPLWWVLWVLQATSPEPRALCVCDPGRLLKRRCCSGRRRRRAWYQLVFSGPETAQLDARRWPWEQRASAAQHYASATKHSLPLCPCITFLMYPDVPSSMLLLGVSEKYCLFPPESGTRFPVFTQVALDDWCSSV